MLFLILRLIIAPLAVLAGTLAQRRFGHAVSGLIIGLPLTSLPMLVLVALQHGTNFAVSMTNSDLIGSLAEVAVMMVYVHLASRLSPTLTMLSALGAFIVVAGAIDLMTFSTMIAGLLAVAGFTMALRFWPRTSPIEEQSGRQRLILRVVLSAGFTFVLISTAGLIGPGLAGLAAAFPIMSMVMAFITHQEHGAHASAKFLQGVAKGSFSYVASIFAFTELLRSGNLWMAFFVALGIALAAQLCVQLVVTFSNATKGLRVDAFSPGATIERYASTRRISSGRSSIASFFQTMMMPFTKSYAAPAGADSGFS